MSTSTVKPKAMIQDNTRCIGCRACMVTGWIMADTLKLSLPAVAFAGLGVLLATNVLTLEDINLQGSTLATFLWLAVLFALSGQLNELGFMGYVGGKLTAMLEGIA